MDPRHLASLLAFVGTAGGLRPQAGWAAEPNCPAVVLATDAGFRERFPELLERVRDEFAGRTDVDACARVGLSVQHDVIGVSVSLPDGRAASRNLTRHDDLIPTLEALLLVPEQQPAAPGALAVPLPPPARTHPRPRRDRTVHLGPDPMNSLDRGPIFTRAPAGNGRDFGFELSAFTGVRLGDGQFGLGLGALSFLEFHHWLVGFGGRVDRYQATRGGDPETAPELALLVGRRLDLGSVALDITGGPALAMRGVSIARTDVVQMDGQTRRSETAQRSQPGSDPVPRMLLGARVGFNPHGVVRSFAGIDAQFGPAEASKEPAPGAARIPSYSAGLVLGATIGTP